MDAMHAIATSVLAQAHVRLGAPARARVLLEVRVCVSPPSWSILPELTHVSSAQASLAKVLEHAPVSLQGEAWLTLAKCDLQQASFKVGWERLAGCQTPVSTSREDAQRRRLVSRAVNSIDRARATFEFAQDIVRLREVCYLQARAYDQIPGRAARRTRRAAARRFNHCVALLAMGNYSSS